MVPYNEFLLVFPNGECEGYENIDMAKATINNYYTNLVKKEAKEGLLFNSSEEPEVNTANICITKGVYEGECMVYNLESFIEQLREHLVFDDEKEEVISKVLKKDIKLNIYDYGLDNVIKDTDVVDVMEPYGRM